MYAAIKSVVTERFTCDPEAGAVLSKLATNRRKAGEILGHKMLNGYVAIMVPGLRVKVYAHHVIYYLSTGVWPPETGLVIDHIDRDRTNNRLQNLRLVTVSENSANHGYSGIKRYRVRGGFRYRADWIHRGTPYRRAGFRSECEAAQWLRESKATHLPAIFGHLSPTPAETGEPKA